MASRFQNLRMRMMGVEPDNKVEKAVKAESEDLYGITIKAIEDNAISKSANLGSEKAYSEPILGTMSINPGYKERPRGFSHDLHGVLRRYSNNVILNAIINTRANQVSNYTRPARYSEKGVGFQVRLKDINKNPTQKQKDKMAKIESFIMNTGVDQDPNRDNLNDFARKVVRDTYTYDQVNFEKVFDKNGRFVRFKAVDPTTIYFGTDEDGNIPEDGARYVQVIDSKIVASFSSREMAFAIRNPRSSIYSAGYGYSELEIALKNFIAHENTETFNDRFFSHGGTTRGILNIKSDQNQSQQALDMFKREWKNSLSGINGSWQIPVVSAEDVSFVNMTPSARDMEFEKWLNYNINMISSIYSIDPAEINFPNRGGATGSGGGSLNEGNSAQKTQTSQNKGLMPLLRFIEETINKHIVAEFGDEFHFQFVGGDTATELEKIQVLSEKAAIAMTMNEVREELGLSGEVPGGDIPVNGVVVQRIGQLLQEEQIQYQRQQDRLNRLLESTGGGDTTVSQTGITFQDIQQGLAGNSEDVDGRASTDIGRGKDGQSRDEENMTAPKQGTPEEET